MLCSRAFILVDYVLHQSQYKCMLGGTWHEPLTLHPQQLDVPVSGLFTVVPGSSKLEHNKGTFMAHFSSWKNTVLHVVPPILTFEYGRFSRNLVRTSDHYTPLQLRTCQVPLLSSDSMGDSRKHELVATLMTNLGTKILESPDSYKSFRSTSP
jgi:hypothetical protein